MSSCDCWECVNFWSVTKPTIDLYKDRPAGCSCGHDVNGDRISCEIHPTEWEKARSDVEAAEKAIVYISRCVWDTIPCEFQGPMADAHAAALNELKQRLTALDAAKARLAEAEGRTK